MKATTLHNLINMRGMRQQMMFATNKFTDINSINNETRVFLFHGMKSCYTKGCEIFTPLSHALKNIDLSEAITIEKIFNGEVSIEFHPDYN